jgi:peptide/nickel transport system permease protein
MHLEVASTLKRDKWFTMGAVVAGFMALIALVGPLVAPFDPQDMSFQPFARPSWAHPLGVNDGGQDILSELVHAVRNSLGFGALVGGLGLMLGVGVGLTAAWLGGLVGRLLMSCADVFMAIPSVMILILVAALFQPSAAVLAMVLVGLSWPTTAKAVRAQALALKSALHVRAAAQMGGSAWYVISRHLVPEMFPLYLIGFVAKARMAVFMEASLAFLGLFDPGRKSLGGMIQYALRYYYMDTWWNWLVPAVFCLSAFLVAASLLAISLEKVLDPRLRSLWG